VTQVHQQTQQQRPDAEEQTPLESAPSTRGDELKAAMDDILDEIDEVLEENAEAFVNNYVQKGGE